MDTEQLLIEVMNEPSEQRCATLYDYYLNNIELTDDASVRDILMMILSLYPDIKYRSDEDNKSLMMKYHEYLSNKNREFELVDVSFVTFMVEINMPFAYPYSYFFTRYLEVTNSLSIPTQCFLLFCTNLREMRDFLYYVDISEHMDNYPSFLDLYTDLYITKYGILQPGMRDAREINQHYFDCVKIAISEFIWLGYGEQIEIECANIISIYGPRYGFPQRRRNWRVKRGAINSIKEMIAEYEAEYEAYLMQYVFENKRNVYIPF